MRDIFYNTNDVGSEDWKAKLNEGELSEWNWIGNNKQEIEKHREEFGLNDGWYLGRLLYALSFKGGGDESGDYTKEDYTEGYAKFEDNLELIKNKDLQLELYEESTILYSLLQHRGILKDLGQDKEVIHSLINRNQKLLDSVKLDKNNIITPKRYNHTIAVFRRADFLFYQMKAEKFQTNHSILYVYKLYNQYKLEGYYEVDSGEWGYEHPLFKRIQQQRLRALKQFKHRLTYT